LFVAGLATSLLVPLKAALAIACLGAALPIGIQLLRSAGLLSTKDNPNVVGAFWPDQLARNALFALGIIALLAALSVYRRVPLDAPADPTLTYLPRPDCSCFNCSSTSREISSSSARWCCPAWRR
jgi:hypothetical protein